MHAYANHPLTWLAAILCCIGVLFLTTHREQQKIPATFLVLYTCGIIFWFVFGLEIESLPVIGTCFLQLIFLFRTIYTKLKEEGHHAS